MHDYIEESFLVDKLADEINLPEDWDDVPEDLKGKSVVAIRGLNVYWFYIEENQELFTSNKRCKVFKCSHAQHIEQTCAEIENIILNNMEGYLAFDYFSN